VERTARITPRTLLGLGAVAILFCVACTSRSGLRTADGAAGGARASSGDTGGPGGYWGGDGIAPASGGGDSFTGAGGYPTGGNVGAGGIDPNCFMRCGQGNAIYYAAGGAGGGGGAGGLPGAADALPPTADGGASDCESRRQVYYAAVTAAAQCDPTATVPCAAYTGVECPTVGVNPEAVADLSARLADYQAAGCTLPLHSCPSSVMTPPPYTCQVGGDGVHRCYSTCENLMGGRATCVGQSADCASIVLTAGYCSGTAMVCCAY
jgi:hypothetical protein